MQDEATIFEGLPHQREPGYSRVSVSTIHALAHNLFRNHFPAEGEGTGSEEFHIGIGTWDGFALKPKAFWTSFLIFLHDRSSNHLSITANVMIRLMSVVKT